MYRNRRTLYSFLAGITLALTACTRDAAVQTENTTQPSWQTDAETALTTARTDGRLVLMDFTGSDWCPPCEVLEAEVFSGEAFARLAADKFVLLKLDFPRRSPQSEELRQQNAALAEKYAVQAFPTVLVADADGTERGRVEGYTPGQPDAWLEQIFAFTEQ